MVLPSQLPPIITNLLFQPPKSYCYYILFNSFYLPHLMFESNSSQNKKTMIFSCDFRNVLRLSECVQSTSLTRCPPNLVASSPPEMASLCRWCDWTDCIMTLMARTFSVAEETFLYYWGPSGDQHILPQRFLLMHELCHDSLMMHI